MANLLLEPSVEWTCASLVDGSAAVIVRGCGSTETARNDCNPDWFTGPETVILGSDLDSPAAQRGPTVARFSVPTNHSLLRNAVDTRIVVACRRESGGLHTQKRGATAQVLLNGRTVDLFGLNTTPARHDDYFHKHDRPLPTEIAEIDGCATIYQWSVPRHMLLTKNKVQTLEIRLDDAVRWDIDHVAMLCKTRHRKLSSFSERFVFQFLILAVLGGILVNIIYSRLGCEHAPPKD